ncbi:MAG: cytochrome c nitrite reductase small subunit [Bryobacterales bacterium]|nr:cytochrome c nitrite reductase small subunit [Bryobacterales bacterium]
MAELEPPTTSTHVLGISPIWWTALAMGVGLTMGVGLFTFGYAQGASYMTNNPDACANCHVMREQHSGWMKSSHGNVAVCNDCHSPAGFVPKYYTKARNGFFHSLAFTTGWFPDNIRINNFNYEVTNNACVKCHQPMVAAMEGVHGEGVDCIQCHNQVGHQ